MRLRALGVCGLVFAILWTIAGLDDAWRRYRGASRGEIAFEEARTRAREAYVHWTLDQPGARCAVVVGALNVRWERRDRQDPWGEPYELACNGDELIVHSRGEDGLDDTADDITSVSSFYGVRPVPLVLSLIAWRNA